jgi:hypothetical protein
MVAAGAAVVQSDFGYSIDSDLTDLDVSFLRPGSNGQTVSFDYGYDAAGRLETGQDHLERRLGLEPGPGRLAAERDVCGQSARSVRERGRPGVQLMI